MNTPTRQLAVVTGASFGICRELAKCCAKRGYDLILAGNQPIPNEDICELESNGAHVDVVEADFARTDEIDCLHAALAGRRVDALVVNAGQGKDCPGPQPTEVRRVLTVAGMIYFVLKVVGGMRLRGSGRILFTGSMAGFMPGSFRALSEGGRLPSFSSTLRKELTGPGITVTCLMPALADRDLFSQPYTLDEKVGEQERCELADAAWTGFNAMLRGASIVLTGLRNIPAGAASRVTSQLVEQHPKSMEPLWHVGSQVG